MERLMDTWIIIMIMWSRNWNLFFSCPGGTFGISGAQLGAPLSCSVQYCLNVFQGYRGPSIEPPWCREVSASGTATPDVAEFSCRNRNWFFFSSFFSRWTYRRVFVFNYQEIESATPILYQMTLNYLNIFHLNDSNMLYFLNLKI